MKIDEEEQFNFRRQVFDNDGGQWDFHKNPLPSDESNTASMAIADLKSHWKN